MENRILEIVFYLMDYLQNSQGGYPDLTDVSLDLKNLGYSDDEISSAYSWLMSRMQADNKSSAQVSRSSNVSIRILTDLERSLLSSDAYSFLIKLVSTSIIDQTQLEAILDRMVLFGVNHIDSEQLKLIISMELFGDKEEASVTALFDDSSPALNSIN